MKASLMFYPNKSKKNQKFGKVPIYMHVCFNLKKSEARLNAELNTEQFLKWDPITMRVAARGPHKRFIRKPHRKYFLQWWEFTEQVKDLFVQRIAQRINVNFFSETV